MPNPHPICLRTGVMMPRAPSGTAQTGLQSLSHLGSMPKAAEPALCSLQISSPQEKGGAPHFFSPSELQASSSNTVKVIEVHAIPIIFRGWSTPWRWSLTGESFFWHSGRALLTRAAGLRENGDSASAPRPRWWENSCLGPPLLASCHVQVSHALLWHALPPIR